MNGFGGIGGWELVLLAVIMMAVLGPERMIKHAFQIGTWARQFSRYWKEGTSAFRQELRNLESESQMSEDLPNLDEIKGLASELRLRDDVAKINHGIAPDTLADQTPEGQTDKSSESMGSISQGTVTYEAWAPPEKPDKC